jgi:cytoskeleton protein RodZ
MSCKMKIMSNALKQEPWEDISEGITKPQSAALNLIGEALRKKRLILGYSLEDISQKTCIRKVYLGSLEQGTLSELPVISYTIGFIRSYAIAVDLDLETYIQDFKEEQSDEKIYPNLGVKKSEEKDKSNIFAKTSPKFLIGLAFICLVIIYGAWFFSQKIIPDQKPMSVDSKPSSPTLETLAPAPSVKLQENLNTVPQLEKIIPVTPLLTEEIVPAQDLKADLNPIQPEIKKENSLLQSEVNPLEIMPPQESIIVLKATEDCWIQVMQNEKQIYQGLLNKGSSYQIPDLKDLTLSVGNATGLEIKIGHDILNAFPQSTRVRRGISLKAQDLIKDLGFKTQH